MKKTMKSIFKAFVFTSLISTVCAESARPPELKISGFTIVNGSFCNQSDSSNGMGGTDPHVSIGASDLTFNASGVGTNGLKYSYRVVFETFAGANFHVKENYVQFEKDKLGTIQAGNVSGPENTMINNGAFLVGGAAGIDGAMGGIFNFSSGVTSGVNYIAQTKRATKIVWYSPKASGFQLGLSFTPNTSHGGQEKRNNNKIVLDDIEKGNDSAIYPDKKKRPFGNRNVTAGISFDKAWGDWSFNLAVVGCTEKTKYKDQALGFIKMHNGKSYQIGSTIGYGQFKVAAGWIDSGKSRLPKDNSLVSYIGDAANGDSGKAWNVGASYTFGPYQIAGAYHRTSRKNTGSSKTSSNILVGTIDYSVFQGLKFFGEIDYIQTNTNSAAMAVENNYLVVSQKAKDGKVAIGDNKGTVVTVGTKISF